MLDKLAYADAALKFIDEHGFDAISMRSLGQYMGVHATAVYRHFPSKDKLVEAVLARMFELSDVVVPNIGKPRDQILGLMRSLRKAFAKHPNLALPNLIYQEEQASVVFVQITLELLSKMGLEGRNLMVAYQMLETFSVGSNAYDWGNYPESLKARQRGRKLVGHPEASAISKSLATMRDLNEDAFELAASALLDACEQLANRKRVLKSTK